MYQKIPNESNLLMTIPLLQQANYV